MMKVVEFGFGRGVRIFLFGYSSNRIDARTHDGARVNGASKREADGEDARQPPSAGALPADQHINRDDEGEPARDIAEDIVARENDAYDFARVGSREDREND